MVPYAWEDHDLGAHASWSFAIAVLLAALLRGVTRDLSPVELYAAALPRAVALDVHLGHARVATMHARAGRATATFTWREARTELLDVDGAVIATLPRNALSEGWTTSIELDDPALAHRLATDRIGGALTLHAGVDRRVDAWARIGNAPAVLEHCVIDFDSGCTVVSSYLPSTSGA